MDTVSDRVKRLYAEYKNWVCKNPRTAMEVESSVKLLSIILTGKLSSSVVVNELVHSATSLYVLFNDQIISSTKEKPKGDSADVKAWLTILHYSEVFIEKAAQSLWGDKGKWTIIACVQIIKCVANLVLLLHYKERIISHPPIPPLTPAEKTNSLEKVTNSDAKINNSFSLKRSGRVVRKVDAAPAIQNRLWKPPVSTSHRSSNNVEVPDQKQLQKLVIGELIHICKPIIHLIALKKYGTGAWKQWVILLAMDLCSLYCLRYQPKNSEKKLILTSEEDSEMTKRYVSLLLYLLRSPFYEKYSETRINAMLDVLGKVIPFIPGSLKNSLIPFLRTTYFYMWSS